MTSRSRAALPGLLALALILTACGGDGDDGAAPATSSAPASSSAADGSDTDDGDSGEAPPDDDDGDDGAAPATSSAPASSSAADGSDTDDGDSGEAPPDNADDGDDDAAPFPANTEPDTGEASDDALLSVTDIRIGRHDGFDRVVFETDGVGTPGWDVRYVDSAESQGSGDDIEVDGGAILGVTISGVGIPADTGVEEYSGPDRLSSGDAEVVTEVVWDSTFEGTSVAFAGVTEETPFRVYLLEDPARVVLEVADPG